MQQANSDSTQGLKVLLEIIPEDQQNIDPVAIGEVGREVVKELRDDGYKVTPEYTGQRGGELLFQTIINYVMSQSAGLGVAASIATIIAPLIPLFEKVFHANEKQEHLIKISLFIDGYPVSVEAANLKEAEAALKIAERYHAAHPAVAPNPATSQIKLQIPAHRKARHTH